MQFHWNFLKIIRTRNNIADYNLELTQNYPNVIFRWPLISICFFDNEWKAEKKND